MKRILCILLYLSLGSGFAIAQEQLAPNTLLLQPSASASKITLTFREPGDDQLANYIKALLSEAYAALDVDLTYVTLPRLRSLIEADRGSIAGELARLPGLDGEYPNLIQVPFPLYQFSLVLVADRRRCGICELEDVHSIAFPSGMESINSLLEARRYANPTVAANQLEQVVSLLLTGRVEGAIMTNFQYRQANLPEREDYIAVTLYEQPAYHYLNSHHQALVAPLVRQLLTMQNNGRLRELRKQFDIHTDNFTDVPTQVPAIHATSHTLRGYTEVNGEGIYWRIIAAIFAPLTDDLTLSASNWARATQMLSEQRADILVGSWHSKPPPGTILAPTQIDYSDPLLMFAADQQQIDAVLAGDASKPVCQQAGLPFRQYLPKQIPIYEANTSLDCFAMLDLGRVAAVLDYRRNLPDWIDSPYAAHQLHGREPVFLAFPDTLAGRQLRNWWELQFRQAVKNGQIKQWFPAAALIDTHLLPDHHHHQQ